MTTAGMLAYERPDRTERIGSSASAEQPAENVPASTRVESLRGANKGATAQAILGRNLFCPTCFDEPEDVEVAAPAPILASHEPLALELVATMESSDPMASLATVRHREAHWTGVFGPGDVIMPGVVAMSVGAGVLEVRRGEAIVTLHMGSREVRQESVPRSSPRRSGKVGRSKAVASASLPGSTDAIECAEDQCVIERSFVESILANPAALAGQAAIRPGPGGFTFTSIRRGSLPELLGLKRGDVLTSVNGEALDSVDKAFELYAKLRRASNLSITVRRGSAELTKSYRIA